MHSYRQVPIRIAEIGMTHRYEKSGALTLVATCPQMSLNDGHTFVAQDKSRKIQEDPSMIIDVYEDFNMTDYRFRLSYRDPEDKHK